MLSKKLNLDEKDRQILRLLLANPKATIADVARELGVQRDTVKYRIERFEKRGLIVKHHVILEPQALGLEVFMLVLIKIKPTPKEHVDTFIKKMQTNKYVTHISRLVGAYDYAFQMTAVDIIAFDAALDEVKRAGEGVIANIELANIIDGLKTDDFSGLI